MSSLFLAQSSWPGANAVVTTKIFLEWLLVAELQVLARHRTKPCSSKCELKQTVAARWQHIHQGRDGLVGTARSRELLPTS